MGRFHLDWGKYNHKADKDKEAKAFVEKYTYDPKGFLKWCKSIDDVYIKDEAKSRFITEEVLELFKKIPCVSFLFLRLSTTPRSDRHTLVQHSHYSSSASTSTHVSKNTARRFL